MGLDLALCRRRRVDQNGRRHGATIRDRADAWTGPHQRSHPLGLVAHPGRTAECRTGIAARAGTLGRLHRRCSGVRPKTTTEFYRILTAGHERYFAVVPIRWMERLWKGKRKL